MEIKGRIIAVMPVRTGTSQKNGEGWASQEYVIETIEQYPKRCVFNVFGEDKLKQFNIQQGGEYLVKFDINAREYNGRWYNDIRAWKVDRNVAAAPGAPVPPVAPAGAPVPPPVADPFSAAPQMSASNEADDLPF